MDNINNGRYVYGCPWVCVVEGTTNFFDKNGVLIECEESCQLDTPATGPASATVTFVVNVAGSVDEMKAKIAELEENERKNKEIRQSKTLKERLFGL